MKWQLIKLYFKLIKSDIQSAASHRNYKHYLIMNRLSQQSVPPKMNGIPHPPFLPSPSVLLSQLPAPQAQNIGDSFSYYPINRGMRKIKSIQPRYRNKKIIENVDDIMKEFSKCVKIMGTRTQNGDQLYNWRLGNVKTWLSISEALKKGFKVYYGQLQAYKNVMKKDIKPKQQKEGSKIAKVDRSSVKAESSKRKVPLFQNLQLIKEEIEVQVQQCAEKGSYMQELEQIFKLILTKKYMRFEKRKAKGKQPQKDVLQISSAQPSQDSQSQYYPKPQQVNGMIKSINANFLERPSIQNQSHISCDELTKIQLTSKRVQPQYLNQAKIQTTKRRPNQLTLQGKIPLGTILEKEYPLMAGQIKLSQMGHFFGKMSKHEKPLACKSGLGLRSSQKVQIITPGEFNKSLKSSIVDLTEECRRPLRWKTIVKPENTEKMDEEF